MRKALVILLAVLALAWGAGGGWWIWDLKHRLAKAEVERDQAQHVAMVYYMNLIACAEAFQQLQDLPELNEYRIPATQDGRRVDRANVSP